MSAASPDPRRQVLIPAGDADVPIDLDDLPTADDEQWDLIVSLLEGEHGHPAPSHCWTRIAAQCMMTGRTNDALSLLQIGTRAFASSASRTSSAAPIHAMLAAHCINQSRSAPKKILQDARYQALYQAIPRIDEKEVHERAATQSVSAAIAADQRSPMSRLSRALLLLVQGKNDLAVRDFDFVLSTSPNHSVALLGKACVLLRQKNYVQALALYQRILRITVQAEALASTNDGETYAHRWNGPDPRIGIGLCLLGLGRADDARRAWKRCLALDPSNAAPNLLLGLTALNISKQSAPLIPGTFGAHISCSETEAREAAYKEGMSYIQSAWKIDNRNAMTAIALCEHVAARASVSSPSNPSGAATEYAKALKLGEHAVQYSDVRPALQHARLQLARTAHLAAHNEGADITEMRPLAKKYYDLAIEAGVAANAQDALPPGFALAVLGQAQLQVSRNEQLEALNTLDKLISKPSATGSACLEPTILAAALRAHPHPGATTAEKASDRERARILLERSLRIIDAARVETRGTSILNASDREEEAEWDARVTSSTSRAMARSSLGNESLSHATLVAIALLGDQVLTHVQLAKLSQLEDLNHAAEEYEAAIRVFEEKSEGSTYAGELPVSIVKSNQELQSKLLTNLGALTVLRGIELPDNAGGNVANGAGSHHEQIRAGLVQQGIKQLQSALVFASKPGAVIEPVRVVVQYNLGRALEVLGDDVGALNTYDALLSEHSEYVDAKVRKALICVGAGSSAAVTSSVTSAVKRDRDLANALLKESLKSDPSNFDTRMTYVVFLSGDLPGARMPQWSAVKDVLAEAFLGASPQGTTLFGSAGAARAVQDEARRDPYALASLGWTYYSLALTARAGESFRADRQKGMLRAIDLLDKALEADPRCAFAAQGMAILLAEDVVGEAAANLSGKAAANAQSIDERRKAGADQALALLSKVRETRDNSSVHVCSGHALMIKEEYERAFKSYELCLLRYSGPSPDATILQQLARASYAQGMRDKSFAHIETSLRYLAEALSALSALAGAASSNEMRYVRYNSAVISQKALQLLFDLKPEERDRKDIERAVQMVEGAQNVFKDLLPTAQARSLAHITAEVIEQRLAYGESSLLRNAPRHLADQVEYEETTRAAREALAAAKREKQLALEARAREQQAEIEARNRELKEQRKRQLEEVGTWEYRKDLGEESARPRAPRKSGAGGRRKKTVNEDGEIKSDSDDALFGDTGEGMEGMSDSSGSESGDDSDGEESAASTVGGGDDDGALGDDGEPVAPRLKKSKKSGRTDEERAQRKKEKQLQRLRKQQAKKKSKVAKAGASKSNGVKKRGKKVVSDESGEEGPTRKRSKKMDDEDMIDSDEEI